MKNKMIHAGTIGSEEMMCGVLANGNSIFVEMALFTAYPEGTPVFDPSFWETRWANGEFADSENTPMVTVYDENHMRVRVPLSEEEAYASYQKASMERTTFFAAKRRASRSERRR